ncbi:MAG: TolC family protein, partial [Gemmatimonadales bacterium]
MNTKIRWFLLGTCVLVALVGMAGPVMGQEVAREVSLDRALEMARQYLPSLEQSASALEMAEYTQLSALGGFLPSVSLGYSYNNSSSGRLDPTGQSITTTNYSAQLTGGMDLFRGLRRFSDLRGAKLGVEASSARYRQAEYQTVEAVKVAYYNAVARRELMRVEADRVQRQEDQLSFVDQQLELGRATRSDVLRSQVDLNNARMALLNAENAARASTYTLAEAVGVTEPLVPEAEADLAGAGALISDDEVLSMALMGAPSLVSARADAAASAAGVASARSAYLPTLRLGGGWAWSNQEFPPQNRSWSVSLSGSLPIFDGFSRENQLYQAQARRDQAIAGERAAEIGLRKDIDAALGTITAAQASIGLAEQTVELSEEDLRVTQERYRLGLATILDLQSAQITLRQAEVDLISRQF